MCIVVSLKNDAAPLNAALLDAAPLDAAPLNTALFFVLPDANEPADEPAAADKPTRLTTVLERIERLPGVLLLTTHNSLQTAGLCDNLHLSSARRYAALRKTLCTRCAILNLGPLIQTYSPHRNVFLAIVGP